MTSPESLPQKSTQPEAPPEDPPPKSPSRTSPTATSPLVKEEELEMVPPRRRETGAAAPDYSLLPLNFSIEMHHGGFFCGTGANLVKSVSICLFSLQFVNQRSRLIS